jgi:exopolysaccharide production protein ExoZ
MGQRRVEWVDALRAAAALGVAWFHLYTDQAPVIPLPPIFTHFALMGRWGVDLFFVISGFVLAYTLIPRTDLVGPKDVGLYFLRRSARLDPTLWVVIVLFVLAQPLLAPRPFAPGFFWDRTIASFFYFLPLGKPNYVPTGWTLAIEVQFYLIFASLMVVLNALAKRGMDRGWLALGVVSAMAVVGAPQYLGLVKAPIGFWIYPHLCTFAIGSAAALVYMQVKHARWLFAATMVLAVIGSIQHAERAPAAVISGLIFIAVILAAPVQRLLARPWLLYLGALSYCIYLLHELVGALIVDWAHRTLAAPSFLQLGAVFVGIAASVLAAAILHRLIEAPSIALSKRIGDGRRTKVSALARAV